MEADAKIYLNNGEVLEIIVEGCGAFDVLVYMESMDEWMIIDDGEILDASSYFPIDDSAIVHVLKDGKKVEWMKLNPRAITYYI